jgi:hypothetical protein
MNEAIWVLIGAILVPIIVFGYFALKLNGFFDRLSKKIKNGFRKH